MLLLRLNITKLLYIASMSGSIKEKIIKKIATIGFSDGSKMINRASNIVVKNGCIGFSIDISGVTLSEAENNRKLAIEEISKIQNLDKINIVLTSQKEKQIPNGKIIVDGVKNIILITAGKGGVGKSTMASLVAQKLANDGKKIGLLDADIYGPSIPNLFNINKKPELIDKRMIPLENHMVKINSIGFITDPKSSVSWRGPMTSKALYQLISLTNWGELDYLIIDTPPGTGDIHLSLLQNYFISGAIMITTPQKISEIDVIKSINLYKKFNIPIIGIIENMSYYRDSLGNLINIFTGNAGEDIAKNHNIELISKIPIIPNLSKTCDQGKKLIDYFNLLDLKYFN